MSKDRKAKCRTIKTKKQVWMKYKHSIREYKKTKIPPIRVAERSTARVWSRSLAGIAGSNAVGSMDVSVVEQSVI